jgi:hypothetical protein
MASCVYPPNLPRFYYKLVILDYFRSLNLYQFTQWNLHQLLPAAIKGIDKRVAVYKLKMRIFSALGISAKNLASGI